MQTRRVANRLHESLFGGKAPSQGFNRTRALRLGKNLFNQLGRLGYCAFKPGQIDQVNADANDHDLFDRHRLGKVARLVNVEPLSRR